MKSKLFVVMTLVAITAMFLVAVNPVLAKKPPKGKVTYTYWMESLGDITGKGYVSGDGSSGPTSVTQLGGRPPLTFVGVCFCGGSTIFCGGPHTNVGMHVDCKDGINVYIRHWFYPAEDPDNKYMLESYGQVSYNTWMADYFEVSIDYLYIWDWPHVKKDWILDCAHVSWTLTFTKVE